jgi:hypothetical protein
MARAIYSAPVGAAVALATGVAKTILAAIAPATFGLDWLALELGFDGVTATDKAILVELMRYTTDGTGTAATVAQVAGPRITAGFTAKYNYSAEPTVGTVLDRWSLTPIGGTGLIDFGDKSYDCDLTQLLGVRLTAPTNTVNANATMRLARC